MKPNDIVTLLRWWEPDTVVRPKTLMREAAAEIERLREERRWISVEERLPKEGVDVLAIDADGVSVQWWEGNRWCSEKFCYTRPTHWMPLPAPPEEAT